MIFSTLLPSPFFYYPFRPTGKEEVRLGEACLNRFWSDEGPLLLTKQTLETISLALARRLHVKRAMLRLFHILPLIWLLFSLCPTATAQTSYHPNYQPNYRQNYQPNYRPNHRIAATPVARHGHLSVVGRHIRGQHGQVTSLAGPSFFWSNTGWGQDRFYTAGAVNTFAKDWNAGIVRVAMGAQNEGSFLHDPEANVRRMETVVQACLLYTSPSPRDRG